MGKQWLTLFWGGTKITADGDCSHDIKRCLLLGRKHDQTRQHFKKQRRYFANKGPSSQSDGFSSSHVWMWELDSKESWELKKWCFWTVVLEKTLESPLDCKEIQPDHSKGISPEYSLEGLMLNLKLQYLATWCEELTHLKITWCWERLKRGGEGGDRGWDGWMASPTQWTWVWVNSGSWQWTGRPGVLQHMGSQRVRQTERLSWTELNGTSTMGTIILGHIFFTLKYILKKVAKCKLL